MKSIASLQAQLLNISKEKGVAFQDQLNMFGSEQFLYRLGVSQFSDKFVFKGGALLTYLINSSRKTRDLDFSAKEVSNQVDDILKVMQSILEIQVNDGLQWKEIIGEPLNHPEMLIAGVRIHCHFLLGKMKGVVHMDVAFGDAVIAIRRALPRIQYKDEPLFPEELSLQVYSPETIFSEKFYIAQKKGAQNTRMKDYYDLFKLCGHQLDKKKLRDDIESTFSNRKLEVLTTLIFDESELVRLETYWGHFLKRDMLGDAPATIKEVIDRVNQYLVDFYDE